MYNAKIPADVTLPSSAQLIKSSIIAFITAMVLLVTVVMPSEYGIDPTGIGKVLGLKEMGEIKTQLAAEAEADRQADQQSGNTQSPTLKAQPEKAAAAIDTQTARQDTTEVTLAPGEGIELKLPMQEGAAVNYRFQVANGKANYDLHGDGSGNSISYQKGRGVAEESGQLVAAFTGNHGWFFRNREDSDITVTLETNGNYAEVKKVK